MAHANRVELLPVIRQMLRQRDLDGQEPTDTVAAHARRRVLELSPMLDAQALAEVRRQPLEKRDDTGLELLAVLGVVGDRGRQASRAPALNHDVEAHEIRRLLDPLAHLRVDEREQISRLIGARAERHGAVSRGSGPYRRPAPAASAPTSTRTAFCRPWCTPSATPVDLASPGIPR